MKEALKGVNDEVGKCNRSKITPRVLQDSFPIVALLGQNSSESVLYLCKTGNIIFYVESCAQKQSLCEHRLQVCSMLEEIIAALTQRG
jgi:hypothetical protein